MNKKSIKYLTLKVKAIKMFDWVLIFFGFIFIIIFAVIFSRKSTYITATVSVGDDSVVHGPWTNMGPKPWFANTFHRGQSEKDGLGRVQSEILDVYSYNVTPDYNRVYIKVKLNCVYNKATNSCAYKGVSVLVGSIIKLNLDKVYAEGIVTEVQGFPTHTTKQIIRVEAQIREANLNYPGTAGTKSYLADAIQIGDTVKDNNDLTLIKIIDKKVTPAKITVTTSDGRAVTTNDPIKKDVLLTLEILAEKTNGRYYFLNNIPILIDEDIPLNTQAVSIFPTVTKFLSY